MNNTLNILVFDDSNLHRLSAKLTLGKTHNVTVVATYDEAQAALLPKVDSSLRDNKEAELLAEVGLSDFNPLKSDDSDKKDKYWGCIEQVEALATTYPNFDVVLTDLLVFPSDQQQADIYRFRDEEREHGAFIALLALSSGVKRVAIVTDMNHHRHPASAAFDCLNAVKKVGSDVRLLCTNRVDKVAIDKETEQLVTPDVFETEEGKQKYPSSDPDYPYSEREGLIYGKDWEEILSRLLAEN